MVRLRVFGASADGGDTNGREEDIIDLAGKFAPFTEQWPPKIIAELDALFTAQVGRCSRPAHARPNEAGIQ
jgi:hypothetical protein